MLEIETLIERLDSSVVYTDSRYRFDRVFKYQKVDQSKDNAQPVQSDNYRKVKLWSGRVYVVQACTCGVRTWAHRVPVTTDRSSYCTVPLLRGWTRLWRARGGSRTTERKVRRGSKACNQNVNYIKMSRRSDQSESPDDGLERRSNRLDWNRSN